MSGPNEATTEGLSTGGRLAAAGALALALVAVLVLVLRGEEPYKVRVHFQSASQLVKGNLVKAAGRPVGKVETIDVTDDGRAEILIRIDEEKLAPLRQGTTVNVRTASFTGLANRFVELHMPPGAPPAIPNNGLIEQRFTTTQVDFDQIFNTFDPKTRAGLRNIFKGSATQYGGRGAMASAGYRYLNPSLIAADRLFREVGYDAVQLKEFITSASRLVTDLASRRDDLAALVDNLATATGAIARRDEDLATAINRLPPFMRRANTTFVNLRATLDDLAPFVEESKPVAKLLRPYLRQLRLFAQDARPTVRDLSALVRRRGPDNDLVELSRAIPPLRDIAIGPVQVNGRERPGSFETAVTSLKGQTPIWAFQRPYAVDLAGWFDDFSHSGIYDANGSASRVALTANAFASVNGALIPVPPSLRDDLLPAVATLGQNNRCPGSIERNPGDGSIPFRPTPDYSCDPSQVPPGR